MKHCGQCGREVEALAVERGHWRLCNECYSLGGFQDSTTVQRETPITEPFDRALLTPRSLWRHKKGGLYLVLGVELSSTNGRPEEEFVSYWSFAYGKRRNRLLEEFLDGRFTPLDGNLEPIVQPSPLESPPPTPPVGKTKRPLTGLFRDNPSTPEGKYLVKRRDGSVPPWPSFVLGGADPHAARALRAYADSCAKDPDIDPRFVLAVRHWADEYDRYRIEHGEGDPGMGAHRVDDPATVEEMRKGRSA